MSARINLICVPHAGGIAYVYMKWKKYLYNFVSLCPIELRGRGRRQRESLYRTMEEAVSDVYEQVKNYAITGKYVLFGHSMGCTLIYEVIKMLMENGDRLPSHVIFSGGRGIGFHTDLTSFYDAEIDVFKKNVMKFGGTSEEIFNNPELSKIFIPIMRADLRILDTYIKNEQDIKLLCDISVFNGKDDYGLTERDKNFWIKCTEGECTFYDFEGGHFYLFNESIKGVVDTINMICLELYEI